MILLYHIYKMDIKFLIKILLKVTFQYLQTICTIIFRKHFDISRKIVCTAKVTLIVAR